MAGSDSLRGFCFSVRRHPLPASGLEDSTRPTRPSRATATDERMNLSAVPWLELTVAVPLLGAAAAACGRDGDTRRRVGSAATALTLVCAVLAWLGHETGASPDGAAA